MIDELDIFEFSWQDINDSGQGNEINVNMIANGTSPEKTDGAMRLLYNCIDIFW
jgi:hypothetical protein